jgi:hypothetical protein
MDSLCAFYFYFIPHQNKEGQENDRFHHWAQALQWSLYLAASNNCSNCPLLVAFIRISQPLQPQPQRRKKMEKLEEEERKKKEKKGGEKTPFQISASNPLPILLSFFFFLASS